MMMEKKKVYAYIMGKQEQKNSLVRAIEVDLDYNNTITDIAEFLFSMGKLKTQRVWISLKQNGTKLNQHVTVKDLESMVEENQQDDIHLYIYNSSQASNYKQSQIEIRSQGKHPSVFRMIDEDDPNPEQLQLIKLDHQITSVIHPQNPPTLYTEHIPIQQSLVENRPRKVSKKQSRRQKGKDQCCLLM